MLYDFANVLVFLATGALFAFAGLLIGKFLRPHIPTPEKEMIYECGEKPIGKAWFNFNPRFYLIALVFVIFEVEIAFLFPVAAVYQKWIRAGRGGVAFWEIAVFALILILGLAYVWAKRDLEWIKRLTGPTGAAPERRR